MNELLPIPELIKRAKAMGVNFGPGNPRTHLAYLAKTHLIPPAIRRKIEGKITGCYEQNVLELLLKIEEMKAAGLSYSEIKWQLSNQSPMTSNSFSLSSYVPKITPEKWFNPAIYLIIGLLLGYFFAVNRIAAVPESLAGLSFSPADNNFVSTPGKATGQGTGDSSVYIITLPGQHLDNLGKTNISRLESN